MEIELTGDQEFFQETTRKFLETKCPISAVRELRDSSIGFDPEYWRQGADLGWTSLLVAEDEGGGSISGRGVIDLTLVANEFGRHASPGPLLGTNVVAATLSRSGTDEQKAEALSGILAGEVVAAWCAAEPAPRDRVGTIELRALPTGKSFVLDGIKAPVEAGAQAQLLLVTARTPTGLAQFLVPVDTPGVTITPMHSLDLTRRFAEIRFSGVEVPETAMVGSPGEVDADVARQLALAIVIQTAETVGAMAWTLDLTVEWAFNRYSFGRPLASYQELKHRFADMKMWLEASHAIAAAAARSVQSDAADANELVSVAKAYIGDRSTELIQDCVQIHGGIGVTYDHDLHLFLRRATVNRVLHGTPEEHLERLATMIEAKEAKP